MKLNPEQILYLRDSAPLKSQVELYVANLGEWFNNNGETFSETLAYVLKQRGQDLQEMKDAVEDGELGIAICGE